jgi:zinc transport system substrate-binding protein
MKQIFDGEKGLQFMVFHPSWGYLAHDYGLKQVPIEIQGKDPKAGSIEGTNQARERRRHQSCFCSAPVFNQKCSHSLPMKSEGRWHMQIPWQKIG